MKYLKQIEKLAAKGYSRSDIRKLAVNAQSALERGDVDARTVLDAIDCAVPKDKFVVFMGFCPDGNFDERRDLEWRAKKVCTFTHLGSEEQLARFSDIHPGDLVVLKKNQTFGKTMTLFGHGRVTALGTDGEGNRCLSMNWADKGAVIEVPAIGCTSTVNVRSITQVEGDMPVEFWTWLEREEASE